MKNYFDLIIIGSGPAGSTASIYASRYKVNHLVIGALPGGLITEAHNVCNFPGAEKISGIDLANKFIDHAKSLGASFLTAFVTKVTKTSKGFEVELQDGIKYSCKALVLATGLKRRKLGLVREKELVGKGVSYCATCDAMFYKDKVVAIVGGSDTAITAALHLSDFATKVYLISRRPELRGQPAWIDAMKAKKNIVHIKEINVVELIGEQKLEAIKLDKQYENQQIFEVNGLFIEIGSEPETQLMENLGLELDNIGYIKVNNAQATNVEGVFAAGDATNADNGFKQVITACSQGAVAAQEVYKYLKSVKK